MVHGLPRAELDQRDVELLTCAIGPQAGVARPQGKASQYLSAVRDAGTEYRSAGGRGYSSNAELDFHTDSADGPQTAAVPPVARHAGWRAPA